MAAPARYTLPMEGPGATGLVARVTGILHRRQLTILQNEGYVSPAGQGFGWMEFEVSSRHKEPGRDRAGHCTLIGIVRLLRVNSNPDTKKV